MRRSISPARMAHVKIATRASMGLVVVISLGILPLETRAQVAVCPAPSVASPCPTLSAVPRRLSSGEAVILARHELWVKSRESRGQRVKSADIRWAGLDLRGKDLRRADLIEVDLTGANLENAKLHGADLQRAKLRCAVLNGAVLDGSDLEGADLSRVVAHRAVMYRVNLSAANLEEARLSEATLAEATVTQACLRGADLRKARLTGADFIAADLSGADLTEAGLNKARFHRAVLARVVLTKSDLSDTSWEGATVESAVYEPAQSSPPEEFARVRRLEFLRFERSPFALQLLRDQLRSRGFREEARAVTYAINESMTARPPGSWRPWVEAWIKRVTLGWTTCYGLCLEWPMVIIGVTIALCSLVYFAALACEGRTGIWKVPNAEWIETHPTETMSPIRIRRVVSANRYGKAWAWVRLAGLALYFSVLSAFAIGKAAAWIARMQPSACVLRPTGWLRTVSAVQAFLTVALIFAVLAAWSNVGGLLD